MGDSKIMHMITDVHHGPDGLSVDYGPGELHEPGTLPEGIGYREVLAGDAQIATAPAHAQPARAKAEPKAEDKPAAKAEAPAAKAKA